MAKTTKQKELHGALATIQDGSVECLGMAFESDDARRAFFLEKLREKLLDPGFRKTPGFPLGTDEDILRLSDPPYYTACPNPFLESYVRHWGRSPEPAFGEHREPFAVDTSVGKTDALYKAHAYHTKVPHLAIVPSVLHYTRPGQMILDGFAGTGMTGVAAQWCGVAPSSYRLELEQEWKKEGRSLPEWGTRRVILNDLSPAATLIAAGYNLRFDLATFQQAAQRLLEEVESDLGWMYETAHKATQTKGRINYTVWSEVFSCPDCTGEVVFVEEALDRKSGRVREEFPCPHCRGLLSKRRLETLYESRRDAALGKTIREPKRVPVLINYSVGKRHFEKKPDTQDLTTLDRIGALAIPPEVPTHEIPYMHMTHERARMDNEGITHLHHFFLPRAAQALAALWRKANAEPDSDTRRMLLFFVEQATWGMSLLARYAPTHYSQVNQYLNGVYYVGSQIVDVSPHYILEGKLKRLARTFQRRYQMPNACAVSTGNCATLLLPDHSIDYIFTDPPFGENIYYADLNFLVESWHGVRTDAAPEAIIDKARRKDLLEYQRLMQRCFEEYNRVLKPGRWMTVVFHNSRNSVWNAIQEGMQAAGFVVADVRTMDKQQGSYRQVTSSAMKQDLVISAYKPNGGLEDRFKLKGGSEEGAWDFVRTHLGQLPIFVSKEGQVEVVAERQASLLYDRMVAFHVLRGVMVPLSATEFFGGLAGRFPERDRMYFLPEQAAEYDKKRLGARGVRQLDLFVHDEASAIEWLREQLLAKPHTLQELTPKFLKEIAGWEKYEKPLELLEIVRQNFLRYDGTGDVPNQIHSYLSTNFKELRKLPKNHVELRAKAKERWYVPDPGKSADLEKLREKALLQEFWEYLPPGHVLAKPEDADGYLPGFEPTRPAVAHGRKMKIVRLEAVRAGFKYCWQNRDYKTIIAVAQRIPEDVLQEDPKLLMWYDQALTRSGPA